MMTTMKLMPLVMEATHRNRTDIAPRHVTPYTTPPRVVHTRALHLAPVLRERDQLGMVPTAVRLHVTQRADPCVVRLEEQHERCSLQG